MNKNGVFEFGILQEGSIFGDISLLLNIPNSFSYFFNKNNSKPLLLLKIKQRDFVSLCKQHPYTEEKLRELAKKRQMMFYNYKMTVYLKCMKRIIKNPKILYQQNAKNQNMLEKIQLFQTLDCKI